MQVTGGRFGVENNGGRTALRGAITAAYKTCTGLYNFLKISL